MMKRIYLIVISLGLFAGCSTDWNFENTGLAEAHFNGSIYEYLKSKPYDWDSLRVMIEHAELTDLFNGTEEITLFGPTNISIRKWMNRNNIPAIRTLDKNECKTQILHYVFKGKLLRDDIPEGDFVNQERIDGKEYTMMSGKIIWIYRFRSTYGGIQHSGPAVIYLRGNVSTDVASANIQPTNGIVHSLNYNYIFGSL